MRRAISDDEAALTECMMLAYGKYANVMAGETLPPLQVDYAKEIEESEVWVAESGDRLLGAIIVVPDSECLSVANIAVHPSAQGQGLGRALLSHAEELGRERGYPRLCLATHVKLKQNVAYYEHLGWSVTGKDDRRVYMEKQLSGGS